MPRARAAPAASRFPALDPRRAGAGPTPGAARRPWLLAELGVLLLAGLVCLVFALREGYPADIAHYKLWTRLVTLQGIEAAYSGTWPETYAIYPPVPLYLYKAVGHAYQAFGDPTFGPERALASQKLTTAIKLVAVGFHLLTGLALFLLVGAGAGPRAGLLASAAYALNPAAIYATAAWGQPDSVHGLFAAVATGLIARDRFALGGAALGLALMAKPQAWAVLPVLAVATLRGGPKAVLQAGLAGAGAGLLPLVPFLLAGRFGEFLTLPARIADVMPVVTANAHNLWWLVTQGRDPFPLESEPLLGPLTYRQAALALVLAAAAFAVWRLGPARPRWRIPLLAAWLAFAWFMLTTQAHENHPFFVLPLLALVLVRHAALRAAFALLTLTFLVNLLAHDPFYAVLLDDRIGRAARLWLTQANALVNLGLLVGWTAWLFRLTAQPAPPRRGAAARPSVSPAGDRPAGAASQPPGQDRR